MEKIKEALEKARKLRQPDGDRALEDSPIPKLDRDSRVEQVSASAPEPSQSNIAIQHEELRDVADVLHFEDGEKFKVIGEQDLTVHYLLSGTVAIESQAGQITQSAEEDLVLRPLEWVNAPSFSLTALTPVEILRVDSASRRSASNWDAPGDEDLLDATEPVLDQQLARLVNDINSEHNELQTSRPSIVDPAALLAEDLPEDSLGKFDASGATMLADLSESIENSFSTTAEPEYVPKMDDEIGDFVRDLEARFARYVERVRAEERARYDTLLRGHAARLQKLAQEQIDRKLAAVHQRYQNAHIEKQRRLQEQYKLLRNFANQVARQQSIVQGARRLIAEKVQIVERIHHELSQLDGQLDHELEDISDDSPQLREKNAS